MEYVAKINVRLPEELNNTLISISKAFETSKADIIRKGLKNYLLDLQEELEDVNAAMEELKNDVPSISWEEVQKNCGLLDS